MEWWKVLIAPLLVAAIVGVASFYFGRITAPESASIDAELKWIDVQNPLSGQSSIAALADLDKYAQTAFKISGIMNFIGKIRFSPSVRIYALTLSNNTSVRSKTIEVTTDPNSVLMSNDASSTQTDLTDKLQIKQLDPGGNAIVYAVSGGLSFYTTEPLHVLHDDRKVDIRSQTIPPSMEPVVRLIQDYPYVVGPILFSAGGALVIVILMIPFAIAFSFSQEFRAKNTSKKEALKLKAFVEYLQQKHPDKLVSS